MTQLAWRRISGDTMTACRRAAAERDRIALVAYPNDQNFTSQRHLYGFLGEALVAAEAGLDYDPDDKPLYDGGCDFPQTDVKATSASSRFLMRLVDQPLRADYYLLVLIDEPRARSAIAGYATRRMVETAPVREFGYGPTRCVPIGTLSPGLPPPLRRDASLAG